MDPRCRARVPGRAHQLRRDRAASPRRPRPASSGSWTLLGDPQHAAPVIHITGTNGKGSTAQIVTRLLDGPGPHRRHVHQPSPRAGQRAHQPQRRARSATTSWPSRSRPSPTSRCWPAWSPATSRSSPRPPSAGSPTSPSTWSWSRSGCWGGGTPPTWSTARSRSSPTSASTTPSTPGRRCVDVAREKAGIVKPGSTSCSARPTPSSWPSSAPTAPGGVEERDVDFDVRRQRSSRSGGRLLELRTPTCDRTTISSSRCTARTRATTPRPRSPRPRRSSARRWRRSS